MTSTTFHLKLGVMSIQEVLRELPSFTVGERQLLMLRSLQLDEPSITPEDELLIESRLSAHRQNPASALTLDQLTAQIRSRLSP
jgi:hypothetical protein